MKQATNITPIETLEEGLYNIGSVISLSGFVGSIIMISHMFIFHGLFSYFYLSLGIVFLGGVFLFPFLKSKRFGEKNMSLAERIVKLEGAIGSTA